jgi:uncharacterized protein YerC
MKRKKDDLTKEDYIKTLDYLYTAAGSMRGRDAVKMLLRDLLTHSERIMLGRRIWIARLLLSGYSYRDIGTRLHVGPHTIRKVEYWLSDQFPGYESAITDLEKELDRRAVAREASEDPFSFATLKRKYPLHFLLFPAPKPKAHYRD